MDLSSAILGPERERSFGRWDSNRAGLRSPDAKPTLAKHTPLSAPAFTRFLSKGHRMLRLSLVASSFLALTAAALLAPAPGKDYTSLPPSPAEIEAQIQSAKVSITAAIEAACKSAGGKANSATMRLENGKPFFDVNVYGGGKAHRVVVDGNGEITSSTEVARFPGDAVSGEWTETPSGLKYYDIKVGTGAKPSGPTAVVTVHYTGWLVDGTKFDSSVDRGQPIDFPLNGVIKGWTEGVQSMQVGGKRKLIIPYALAYGEGGQRSIPPKATLVFDVELLNAK